MPATEPKVLTKTTSSIPALSFATGGGSLFGSKPKVEEKKID
jgi:hypothetical protein